MRRSIGGLAVVLLVTVLAWVGPAQATPAPPPDTGGSGEIVGGTLAAPGEFPYQVGLLRAGVSDPFQAQFCGGSLLTSTRVLTAAHCVEDFTPSQVEVWANTVQLSPGAGTRRAVSSIHIHPNWNTNNFRWDLAILNLQSAVPGTPISFARPADANHWSVGTRATVTGWGNTVFPGPVWPSHLRKARVPIVSTSSCNTAYSGQIHGQSMFCAGFSAGGTDACQGDSGGPIAVRRSGTWLQVGIVSWGTGCALPGLPGVYARTDTSADWIMSRVPAGCGAHAIGPFPDVLGGHAFCGDIQWLSGTGVTGGYGDNTFRPSSPVTRGSMAAFLYRFAGSPAYTPPATSPFTDVPTSHVFYKEITWLASTGVAGGYPDDSFRPSSAVTRASMSAFLYRYAGQPPYSPGSPSFGDVPANHLFFKEIEWLANAGVTDGYADNTFRPGNAVTRGSMAAFLHRYDGL